MATKHKIIALVAGAAILGSAGCGQRLTAERDGKKIGQGICDLRNAGSVEDAQDARNDIAKQLDDLNRKFSFATVEDRRDVDKNLADLAEHSVQGNDVLKQQDLAVLERSIKHIAEDSNEVSRAAWEGVNEGLEDCTQ
jgi:hypothetical protein